MSLPNPCNLTTVGAQFDASASYMSDLTGQTAQNFLDACIWLTGRRASMSESAMRADARFSTTYADLDGLMEQCQRWLANNVQVGGKYDLANLLNRAPVASQFGLNQMRGWC